jgi:hypothetical protein
MTNSTDSSQATRSGPPPENEPHSASPLAWLFILLLRFYKAVISPHLPVACRYTPTCSIYALGAMRRFGAFKGSWLTAGRLLRCQPWGGFGEDPVPEKNPAATTRTPETPPHE